MPPITKLSPFARNKQKAQKLTNYKESDDYAMAQALGVKPDFVYKCDNHKEFLKRKKTIKKNIKIGLIKNNQVKQNKKDRNIVKVDPDTIKVQPAIINKQNNILDFNLLDLNEKQKSFAIHYLTSANAVESFALAYNYNLKDPQEYSIAVKGANRLIANPKFCFEFSKLLNQAGFNDANVDNHHNFLITQLSDYRTKLNAIKHYNELKGRIQKPTQINNPVINLSQILEKVDE